VVARTREQAIERAGTDNISKSRTCWTPGSRPHCGRSPPSAGRSRPTVLKYYYPTSALFTAQEILYLWVARMVMTGLEFLDEKPFNDVYIHATILDEHGRRMSKSAGNGVDPVELIDLYGADALRFALASQAGQRQDIRIKPIKDGKQEQVEQARNFANKIWNASRFALMNLADYIPPADDPQPSDLVDRWILSRLDATAEAVNAAFASYNMDDAARALYEFFWDDFCDWYIEAAKPRFQGENADAARHVLWFTLERTLRLLHPIMPYLTEAIWQTLPGAKEQAGRTSPASADFLMFAPFPQPGIAPATCRPRRTGPWSRR
jgi:valyl-tRNA synthetase